MPIVQSYKINTPDAYEGMVYGLRTAMTVRTVVAEEVGTVDKGQASIIMGGAVELDATKTGTSVPVVKNIAAETAASKSVYGIIIRQINHEAASRPSLDGKMAIMKGDLLGMMVEGEIMVKLNGTVASNQTVGFTTSGEAKHVVGTNVVALKGGQTGDIIPVRIFSVTPAPAAK